MGKKHRHNKWKIVDPGVHADSSDLVSIEELVDYTAIRGKRTYSEPIIDDDATFKKKRRKKKNQAQKRKAAEQAENESPKKIKPDVETPSIEEEKESDSEPEADMSAWNDFNLPDPIVKALAAKKFLQPTEIQVIVGKRYVKAVNISVYDFPIHIYRHLLYQKLSSRRKIS